MLIDLFLSESGTKLGSITERDLEVLMAGLEEESASDRDYYIDTATIDVLADGRATDHLVGLLRAAVGSGPGVDIRWERRPHEPGA